MIITQAPPAGWYTLEGDFDPKIRLRLRPYNLMTAVDTLPNFEPDAEMTNAQRGRLVAEQVIAELIALLEDWDGVDMPDGEKAPVSAENITALIVQLPNTYVPIRKILDEHRAKWEKEGNVSRKRSRGRPKGASTTAKPAAARRRRARKENQAPTGNGALMSSTDPGP